MLPPVSSNGRRKRSAFNIPSIIITGLRSSAVVCRNREYIIYTYTDITGIGFIRANIVSGHLVNIQNNRYDLANIIISKKYTICPLYAGNNNNHGPDLNAKSFSQRSLTMCSTSTCIYYVDISYVRADTPEVKLEKKNIAPPQCVLSAHVTIVNT